MEFTFLQIVAVILMRIYLDSNVFISLFQREIGRDLRGLFIDTDYFIRKVKAAGHILVLSNLFFKEIYNTLYMGKEDVILYFRGSGIGIECVSISDNPLTSKFKKLGIHHLDSLHIAAAIEQKCDCIVTFNVKDFEKAANSIPVYEPSKFP